LAGTAVVARATAIALGRLPAEDARIAAAVDYATALGCPWSEHAGALDDVVPRALATAPTDDGTSRFDRELLATWNADRPALIAALATCTGRAGHWQLAKQDATCVATFRAGWPEVTLAIAPQDYHLHARCSVAADDRVLAAVRGPVAVASRARIRVVSAPLG